MTRPTASIRKKELISFGLVILNANDTAVLMPFDDDVDYKLIFKLNVDEESDPGTTIALNEDGILSISHFRNYKSIISTGSQIRQSFASDETHDFYFSFVVASCQSPRGEIFQLNYNVFRTISK